MTHCLFVTEVPRGLSFPAIDPALEREQGNRHAAPDNYMEGVRQRIEQHVSSAAYKVCVKIYLCQDVAGIDRITRKLRAMPHICRQLDPISYSTHVSLDITRFADNSKFEDLFGCMWVVFGLVLEAQTFRLSHLHAFVFTVENPGECEWQERVGT